MWEGEEKTNPDDVCFLVDVKRQDMSNRLFYSVVLYFMIIAKFPLQRVHCGCIVSALAFALLDPGGIECMSCARKNLVLVIMNLTIVGYLVQV